jgi:di/tricarboxylate transporter
MLTVAVLMVASQGVAQTGGLGYYATKFLGVPKSTGSALVRALCLGGLISSFVNDTPTYLLLLPVLQSWSVKLGLDIRTFLLPMSFTVLLGGTNTLIGTSTNLAVAGEFVKFYPNLTLEFFGITRVGIPVFFWGLSYLFLFSEVILPSKNKASRSAELEHAKQQLDSMTLQAKITPESVAVGKTIEEAGLRGSRDLYLFSVRRGGKILHAVNPTFTLQENDDLFFSGAPDTFARVCKDVGLAPLSPDGIESQSLVRDHVVTVVVCDGSSIVGMSPKEAQFRSRFKASILGIQRVGGEADIEIGQVQFQVGDVLALLVDDSFNPVSTDLRVVDLKTSNSVGDHYLISALVAPASKIFLGQTLGGKTIEQANLRGISNAFLVAVVRADTNEIVRNPDPSTVINVGDTLWFTGNGTAVIQAVRRIPGVELVGEAQANKLKLAYQVDRKLVEIVIAPTSFLVGSSVREIQFRTRFGAAVVAIRRGGESSEQLIGAKLGDVPLRVGDVLLLDAAPEFLKVYGSDPNFLVVNALVESSPVQFRLFFISLFLFIAIFVIFVATSTTVSLIPLGLVICGIMVYLGVLTPAQARAAVNWEVLYTIAAASALSTALTKTGLANQIGGSFVELSLATGGGRTGVIAALYLATMLISLLVANNAAALIMFAIGRAIVKVYPELDPLVMAYTIMLAASASFMIPYGYQTNIMSLSLGPYTTLEAVKFGTPLQIILIPVSILAMADYNGAWYAHVIVSLLVFFLAVGVKLFVLKGRPSVLLQDLSLSFSKETTSVSDERPGDNASQSTNGGGKSLASVVI